MLQVKLFLTVRQFAILLLFSTLVNLFKPAIPKVNDQSLSKLGPGTADFLFEMSFEKSLLEPLKTFLGKRDGMPLLKCIVIRFQTKTNFFICVLKQF